MPVGRVISFEGYSNAGKSTVIQRLRPVLQASGFQVVVKDDLLHYKGDSIGRQIKKILEEGSPTFRLGFPIVETLLICAKRAFESQTRLEPAVVQNAILLLDRDIDTVCAYQLDVVAEHRSHLDRSAIVEWIRGVNRLATIEPDLTFYLHVSPEECLQREEGRRAQNRQTRATPAERQSILEDADERLTAYREVLDIELSGRKLCYIDTCGLSLDDVEERVSQEVFALVGGSRSS